MTKKELIHQIEKLPDDVQVCLEIVDGDNHIHRYPLSSIALDDDDMEGSIVTLYGEAKKI